MGVKFLRLATVLVLTGLLASCTGAAPVRVWIDVPVTGVNVPLGQPLQIEGHAAGPGAISRVVIWINGSEETTLSDPPVKEGLARYVYDWTPPAVGDYTIQAIAYGGGGEASQPDLTHISVGATSAGQADLAIRSVEAVVAGMKGSTPFCNTRVVYTNAGTVPVPASFPVQFFFDGTPQHTVTVAEGLPAGRDAELTFVYQFTDMHYIGVTLDTTNSVAESNESNNAFAESRVCGSPISPTPPTPVTSALADVQFWIEPEMIKAGDCAVLHWRASNIKSLTFGGKEQPFEGSYKDCPCVNQRYALSALDLEGKELTRQVDLSVSGVCTTPSAPLIQFWAEPEKVKAGGCTTVKWHVENVQTVVFGGVEQPFDGSYKDCLCSDQAYTLKVTHLDGSQDSRKVKVVVSGTCVTEVPEEIAPPAGGDTTAPPVPGPAVPANGLSLSCRSAVSLVWLPVQDESGIAQYQVEVQRQVGKKWAAVSGSPFTGIKGKTMSLPVECGFDYRWRVRAVDGKGNTSAWSGWSQFSIPLG